MSNLTIEQLEALKEGTTPGPWGWHNNVYDPDDRFLHSHNGSMCLSVDDVGSSYFEGDPILMAAAPALVDALIAEKRAHAELRAWVESLHPRVGSVEGVAVTFHKANFLDEITRVLEGDDD